MGIDFYLVFVFNLNELRVDGYIVDCCQLGVSLSHIVLLWTVYLGLLDGQA